MRKDRKDLKNGKNNDAYGTELLSAYRDPLGTLEIVERADGLISTSPWPARYFSGFPSWSRREKQAASLARGRVLDIGCGAGRFALYLQAQGLQVTAIDNSPGAIRVCRLRGVKDARMLSIADIGKFKPATFATVLMMGNNFGLFGSMHRAKILLRKLYFITSGDGTIIAEAVDPYSTRDPLHLAYQKSNRKRGRMSGQLRIRIRHKNIIGPWFDYLLVSRKEMALVIEETGWRIGRIISAPGPGYTAVMIKS
jgi:SAM-dependent methyltransferase